MPDDKAKLIPVFALRPDGKNVTCHVKAFDADHARNKMRWWMEEFSDRGHDCEPNLFTFYVGEENHTRFLQDRREILIRRNLKTG